MAQEIKKKLKVGWFSFSCCEDSTIMMAEYLNDHRDWLKLIDFKHALVLKSKNTMDDLDVAFVEGAIASDEQEKKLKEIRSKCKKLVAIGTCACTGMPSGHRNNFDDKTKKEIEPILLRFKYGDRVQKLEDLVQVDDKVPGCPMLEDKFIEVVNKMLKEFGI